MIQHNINHQATSKSNFIHFLFKNKENRSFLQIAAIAAFLQFIIFKLLYPFPDFFSDSYSYIYAAQANLDINIWPIGYSKFLRMFHFITHSDTGLVAFQYFLLELSATYFFFTILYFYSPVKTASWTLFAFLFFNPLLLYLSNYVNSDPIFVSLSMFWFAQLLWIIHNPATYQIFVQAMLLFFCFAVRNNAYYYPLIAAISFLLSRKNYLFKSLGIIMPFFLIVPFIIHTRNVAEKMTGSAQFSLFTGWQLANNALYMYADITVDNDELPSKQSKELDQLSKQYYNRVIPEFKDALSNYVGNFFIRQPKAPLKKYMDIHYKTADDYSQIIAWGKSSIVFSEYGTYLIKKNPIAYIREYMLLNTKNYFFPQLEKLEVYNLGTNEVDKIAQDWFNYNTKFVTSISKSMQGNLFILYPALFFVINLYFIGIFIYLIVAKITKKLSLICSNTLILSSSFLLANFLFCISATIIVFRYLIFPMIVCFSFSILLIDLIGKSKIKNKMASTHKELYASTI